LVRILREESADILILFLPQIKIRIKKSPLKSISMHFFDFVHIRIHFAKKMLDLQAFYGYPTLQTECKNVKNAAPQHFSA